MLILTDEQKQYPELSALLAALCEAKLAFLSDLSSPSGFPQSGERNLPLMVKRVL